ncbi:MAG: hypothetical protein WC651_03210 [Candidatus Gracilibacteria bacterium]|jgi:hypothetical protein
MTLDLAAEYGDGITCEFDTSTVKALAAQFAQQLEPWKAAYEGGVLSINEYRGKLKLEPLPGNAGDVLMMPTSKAAMPATEKAQQEADARAAVVAEQMAEQAQPDEQQEPGDAEDMAQPGDEQQQDQPVKSVRFIPNGADEPRVPVPMEITITEDDSAHALDDWNTLMPEYAGLLDSPVVNKASGNDAN